MGSVVDVTITPYVSLMLSRTNTSKQLNYDVAISNIIKGKIKPDQTFVAAAATMTYENAENDTRKKCQKWKIKFTFTPNCRKYF